MRGEHSHLSCTSASLSPLFSYDTIRSIAHTCKPLTLPHPCISSTVIYRLRTPVHTIPSVRLSVCLSLHFIIQTKSHDNLPSIINNNITSSGVVRPGDAGYAMVAAVAAAQAGAIAASAAVRSAAGNIAG